MLGVDPTYKGCIWSNYSDLTGPCSKWWFRKGNLLFQGNLAWWNIIIWPDGQPRLIIPQPLPTARGAQAKTLHTGMLSESHVVMVSGSTCCNMKDSLCVNYILGDRLMLSVKWVHVTFNLQTPLGRPPFVVGIPNPWFVSQGFPLPAAESFEGSSAYIRSMELEGILFTYI